MSEGGIILGVGPGLGNSIPPPANESLSGGIGVRSCPEDQLHFERLTYTVIRTPDRHTGTKPFDSISRKVESFTA